MKPPIKTILSKNLTMTKSNFVHKGVKLGFEMAEKRA